MEITQKFKERSTVITAMVTFAFIGFFLIGSTWQTMRHQSATEDQHLYLTSRSILLALESSLRKGPVRARNDYLSPLTRELFDAFEEDGDVLFAGILNHRGSMLLTSNVHQLDKIDLPKKVYEGLITEGQWHGKVDIDGNSIYVSGKTLESGSKTFRLTSENPVAPVFLLVGIETEKYLTLHKNFRKNFIYQSIYMLAAALTCWIFAFSFLSRRDKAKRTERLERFQTTLLDNLPDGLLTMDATGKIQSANPAAIKILANGSPSLVGKTIDFLPGQITPYINLDQTTQSKFLSGTATHMLDIEWKPISYKNMHLEVLSLPIQQDAGAERLIIIRDRTQLRSLEQSLADAEKLAMIGTLAAGVAHEVRNPLSALRGFAQYFLKKLAGRHPEEEYARTMVSEADRLNRVITDLLFLAKPKHIQPETVSIDRLVKEIHILLSFDLEQKNINLETNISESTIYADADALKQSLLNLLLNSLDATTSPSTLCIATGKDLNKTWIEVQDQGCGMTDEQIVQAFEPFFTMKTRGTGLGLALVQRTMTDHGGSASIISELGKGCTIRLVFPPAPQYQEKNDATDNNYF